MQRRRRLPIARVESIALPPGTLRAPTGALASTTSVMSYGKDQLTEFDPSDLGEIRDARSEHSVTWVDVAGLADVEHFEALGLEFGLHHLALEDTMNIPQRPKIDDYGSHQYIVARMPISGALFETEQLSIFLGDGYLVTVQERQGDCFEAVRKRIRDGRPRIRTSGSDYLAYAIIDALVDSYLPVIESIAARLDEVELSVLAGIDNKQVAELHDMKRDLVTLRRYLEPLRELIANLVSQDNEVLGDEAKVHMRDCLDHSQHALDHVESCRANVTAVMDLHLSIAGQRMNEVMKVLTVIATVFIPLSFIAGLYGMNFDPGVSRWNMPELGWTFGYPFALTLMALCGLGMLVYFWRKGWFK